MTRNLISIYDVKGAAIVGLNGSVIYRDSGDIPDFGQYIDFTATAIQRKTLYHHQGMFNGSIMDFNGHKILLTIVKPGITLMLVVDKKAYLGLTMLDVECCLRGTDNSLYNNFPSCLEFLQ